MKTTLPLAITFIMGVIMFIQFFIPHPYSKQFYELMLQWLQVIAIFAICISLSSAFRLHTGKIKRRVKGWGYNVVALISLVVMALIGFIGGVQADSLYMKVYLNVLAPLQSTMFSLLAFYMTSAAYRAFRARSWQASLLLLSGIIVMLGRIPLGDMIVPHSSSITQWIMRLPVTAAMRGIMLGVGIGSVATSLKIVLGIERSYMGGGGGN